MQPQDYYNTPPSNYNSPPQPYRSSAPFSQKFLLTIGILLGVAILLFLIAQSVSKSKHSIPANQFIAQQETISKHDSWLPSFDGMSVLTDRGLSGDQLTGIKYAFGLYVKQLPAGAHHVVVDENSIQTSLIDRNHPSVNRSMTGDVKIDGTTHKATIGFSILTSETSLTLQDSEGNTIYQSGAIDINTQTPRS